MEATLTKNFTEATSSDVQALCADLAKITGDAAGKLSFRNEREGQAATVVWKDTGGQEYFTQVILSPAEIPWLPWAVFSDRMKHAVRKNLPRTAS
jgi:hypothetical protein